MTDKTLNPNLGVDPRLLSIAQAADELAKDDFYADDWRRYFKKLADIFDGLMEAVG